MQQFHQVITYEQRYVYFNFMLCFLQWHGSTLPLFKHTFFEISIAFLFLLSHCLHKAVDTIFQNDALILTYIFHTRRTLHINHIFQLFLQKGCFDINFFCCKSKMHHYQQQYSECNVTHDQQIVWGEINSGNLTVATCYQLLMIHNIVLNLK